MCSLLFETQTFRKYIFKPSLTKNDTFYEKNQDMF